jgi:hypothetical protein
MIIALMVAAATDAHAHIIVGNERVLSNDLPLTYEHPAPVQGMSREEFEWRRSHPEIPRYMPYTPDYGPYDDPNGKPRFQGIPDPYYREAYPPIDYHYIYQCWRDRGGRCIR